MKTTLTSRLYEISESYAKGLSPKKAKDFLGYVDRFVKSHEIAPEYVTNFNANLSNIKLRQPQDYLDVSYLIQNTPGQIGKHLENRHLGGYIPVDKGRKITPITSEDIDGPSSYWSRAIRCIEDHL